MARLLASVSQYVSRRNGSQTARTPEGTVAILTVRASASSFGVLVRVSVRREVQLLAVVVTLRGGRVEPLRRARAAPRPLLDGRCRRPVIQASRRVVRFHRALLLGHQDSRTARTALESDPWVRFAAVVDDALGNR